MKNKQTENFEYFMVGQKAALIRDGKCLIVESAAMPGFWELPGGRINKGEFKELALRREIKEEIGLNEFDILGIVDYDICYNKDANAAFCVTVHLIKNDLDEIILSDESLQYKWITEAEIDEYDYYRGFYSGLIKKSFALHKFLNKTNLKSKLSFELKKLLNNHFSGDKIKSKFLQRIKQGKLTRDENPESHFCVMFAAYDSKSRHVFIGDHKKAGKWLFSGGHIDEGETINETLAREMDEEWGLDGNDFEIKPPDFLAITEIDNPTKQPCNFHYDLWFFISVDKNNFKPAEEKLLKEFHEFGWKSLDEARKTVRDPNTLLAIDFIENNYFNSK